MAVRYGATRQQFGPPGAPEVAVLDYSSQQAKLMPLLASAYALHAATRFLVGQYAEAKRTKEEDLVADVHSLSAGGCAGWSAGWSGGLVGASGAVKDRQNTGCLERDRVAASMHQW